MQIVEKVDITKKKSGHFVVAINGAVWYIANPTESLERLYNDCKGVGEASRKAYWEEFSTKNDAHSRASYDRNFGADATAISADATSAETNVPVDMSAEEKVLRGIDSLINFFTEFNFEPNFRFVNTLCLKLAKSKESAKKYIANYFALIDSSFKDAVKDKMRSAEFKAILSDLSAMKPTNVINNRFRLYYGSAGTGKTTLAMEESDNRCIVCNASMLPSDLMEDFVFVDGKPSFAPSVLWNCMTEGKKIVLDEINLLPFDSLRFLQGVLDGKKEFDYKGHKVTISDGFEIIGTMNLMIGGMVYGLPDPLIDRSSDIREFKLSAEMLMSAVK